MAGSESDCKWPACSATFGSGEALFNHLMEVHAVRKDGEAFLDCKWPDCRTRPKFSNAANTIVKEHIISHTDWIPYPCPSCSRTYRAERGLLAHLKLHHEYDSEGDEDDDSQNISDDSDAVVVVDPAHRVPLVRPAPQSHSPAPASRSGTKASSKDGNLSCQWSRCDARFRDAEALYTHICDVHVSKSGQGPCLWKGCPYTDPLTAHNLRQHVKARHAHDGSYACKPCNSVFGSEDLLKKHTKAAHPSRSRRAIAAPAKKKSPPEHGKRKAVNGGREVTGKKKPRVDSGSASSKPAATGGVAAPAQGGSKRIAAVSSSNEVHTSTINPNALLAHVAAQWEQQVAEHLTGIAINVANRMSGALGQAPGSLPPPT
ncbi:hypothetical protein EXIGLDRAFT_749698 [Exidia glandulosa HHB12029]|uniref:C2H2-type domain-containing protein n=1 Tax=Exidia glandulosa HHB12029 TaxID=1314781 RepID=A0A165HS38_EXIGL|nr:hypothetical protein EXIGLDRAFT_749698 [Exidia glandulosa HHB12029]